jgi:hypothetical protein
LKAYLWQVVEQVADATAAEAAEAAWSLPAEQHYQQVISASAEEAVAHSQEPMTFPMMQQQEILLSQHQQFQQSLQTVEDVVVTTETIVQDTQVDRVVVHHT